MLLREKEELLVTNYPSNRSKPGLSQVTGGTGHLTHPKEITEGTDSWTKTKNKGWGRQSRVTGHHKQKQSFKQMFEDKTVKCSE